MIILIILIVLLGLGILIANVLENDNLAMCGVLMLIVSGACLIVSVIALPCNRMEVESEIAKFEAMQETLSTARAKDGNIENAALQLKVAEANQWLASRKYYNKTVFDLWIPDEIEQLESIK